MILQQLIPVIMPIPSGNSGPMTLQDVKIMIGILIVMTIPFIISLLITIPKYLKIRDKYDGYFDFIFNIGIFHFLTQLFIGIVWGIIGVFYLGIIIANFL